MKLIEPKLIEANLIKIDVKKEKELLEEVVCETMGIYKKKRFFREETAMIGVNCHIEH